MAILNHINLEHAMSSSFANPGGATGVTIESFGRAEAIAYAAAVSPLSFPKASAAQQTPNSNYR